MICFFEDPKIGSLNHPENLAYILRHKSITFRFQKVFNRFKDLNYDGGYRLIQLRLSVRSVEYQ